MNYYPFLLAVVLWHAPLFPIEEGKVFSTHDIQAILNRPDQKEDLIVLNDGTRLNGKVPKLPQLHFFFGNIPINIDDGAAIAFCTLDGQEKMQIITRDGHRFIGEMPYKQMILVQSFPSVDRPSYTTEQEIDPHTINCIFFKKRREARTPASLSSLHTLSLNNGDQIPIVFAEDHIPLSNGWKDFSLQTDEIVSINFDGGLYGKLEDCQGNSMELDYAFVKDKYLHVQIAGGTQRLGIPWEKILSIHKEKPLPSHGQGVGINFAERAIQNQQIQETIDGQSGEDLHALHEEALALEKEEFQIKEDAYASFLELEVTRGRVFLQALNQLTSRQKNRQELQNQIDELKHLLTQEKEASQDICADLEKTIGERQYEIEKMQLTYGELYSELISQITTQKEQIQTLQEELRITLAKCETQSELENQLSLQSCTQEKIEECAHDCAEETVAQLEE